MLPSEVSTEQQDDDLNLRRSLRLVEDLAFSSNSTTIKSSAQLQSNVRNNLWRKRVKAFRLQ